MARNFRTMSDATLAANAVEAKRAANAAVAAFDAIAAEIRNRPSFGTVESNGGKVTLSESSERVALDTDKAKTLIPNWELVCAKRSTPAPSVRVTFS